MLSVIYKIGDEDRLEKLATSLRRVDAQGPNVETVVAVGSDVAPENIHNAGADVMFSVASTSLTFARNAGARRASGDIIAFMDDDAYPGPGWADAILEALGEHDMAGGPLEPEWRNGPVSWLPETFHWLIGCGPYYDRPGMVPNTYGSNLAIRREAFEAVGGFDESIGMGSRGVGQGAETDLCRRIRSAGYEGVWYDPDAVVRHVIDDRGGVLPLHRRAYDQGRTKAEIGIGTREVSFVRDELLSAPGSISSALATLSLTASVGLGYACGRCYSPD